MELNLNDKKASNQINELISKGWEFFIHYGDNKAFSNIDGNVWEADFTRKLSNGLWDNHESGYGNTPEEAIDIAYNNIINGIKINLK